jgi:acetyltransferase
LSDELAARLSHIDYEREMALLAFAEGAEELLGVARHSADRITALPNSPSQCHVLMTRLTQVARQRGIPELIGEVLPENTAMLRLCQRFGFAIATDPGDPKLLRVSKTLRDPEALVSA